MSRQVLRNHRLFHGTRREAAADGTVTAGDLVELTANGIQSQSTDGEVLESIRIAEDARGRGYEAGDTYSDGETTPYLNCNAGDLVTLRLADGESVQAATASGSTPLVPNGDGTVRAENADSAGAIVAVADETLDNTSGSPSLLDAEVTR